MNEKWLKDIHDRMNDYELDAPEGLWESIRQKMPEDGKSVPVTPKVTPLIPLWVRRTAGVAAAVAIAFLVGNHFLQDASLDDVTALNSVSSTSQGEQNLPQERATGTNTLAHVADAVSKLSASLTKSTLRQDRPLVHAAGETHDVTMAQTDATASSEEKNRMPDSREEKKNDIPPRQYVGNSYHHPYVAQTTDRMRRPQQASHMSVSAFATGFVGGMSTSHEPMRFAASAPIIADTGGDRPLLGALVYKVPGKDISSVKHRQPVRVGVTFAYGVTEKVAVESGLTYTNLSSDRVDGTENSYFATSQSLHYVGIPLNVKYKAYDKKQLTVYATAGVLAEKRVSGKIDETFVVDDQPVQTTHETVKSKPLQMSVNAAVGVQLNVTDNIGVYAEPGVSYYYKDGSGIKTIYQEKPCNFNLNVGVRVSISK